MISSREIFLLNTLFKFIKGTNRFNFLKRRLPKDTIKLLNGLLNLICKIVIQRERLWFYRKCIQNKHYPISSYKSLRRNKSKSSLSNLQHLAELEIDEIADNLSKLIETHQRLIPVMHNLS
ncbi:unnamed protein product [Trichobilharzia regenti]|nr:unnamed protein product [Trichobilharzia regenti]